MKHLLVGLFFILSCTMVGCLNYINGANKTKAQNADISSNQTQQNNNSTSPQGPNDKRGAEGQQNSSGNDGGMAGGQEPVQCQPRNDLSSERCSKLGLKSTTTGYTMSQGTAENNCVKGTFTKTCTNNGCGQLYYTKWQINGKNVSYYSSCNDYVYKNCQTSSGINMAHGSTATRNLYKSQTSNGQTACNDLKISQTGTCFNGAIAWVPAAPTGYIYTSCTDQVIEESNHEGGSNNNNGNHIVEDNNNNSNDEDRIACQDQSKYYTEGKGKSVTLYNAQYCPQGKNCSKTFSYICQSNGRMGYTEDPGEYKYTTRPITIPSDLKVVTSLQNNLGVPALYACGNFVYAVTKKSVKINNDIEIVHQLKRSIATQENFTDVSLREKGSSEKNYLLDGLTCINNSFLAGLMRYRESAKNNKFTHQEQFFLFDPINQVVRFSLGYEVTNNLTDTWKTPNFRHLAGASANTDPYAVVTDLIAVSRSNNDVYHLHAYYVDNGQLWQRELNFPAVSSLDYEMSFGAYTFGGDMMAQEPFYDATTVEFTKDPVEVKYPTHYFAARDRQVQVPFLMKTVYLGTVVTRFPREDWPLTNMETKDANIDTNLVRIGDKVFMVYRKMNEKGSTGIDRIYDISNFFHEWNFDGSKKLVAHDINDDADALIKGRVYVGDGVYAYVNNDGELCNLKQDKNGKIISEVLTTLPSTIPAKYAYLLKNKALQELRSKVEDQNKSLIAASTKASVVFITITPKDKDPLVLKGSISSLEALANSL